MSKMNDESSPATKGDLHALRVDFRSLRDDFRALQLETKADIKAFADEFRDMFRSLTAAVIRNSAEIADVRGYIKDRLVTRDEFHARMDAFTGRVSDFDYSQAKQRDRLDDHERRISALETKPKH